MSNKKRGILMAEVGISTLLLALMVVPAMGMLGNGAKGTAQSHHLTRAIHVARAALDAADSLRYHELSDTSLEVLVNRIAVPDGVARPRLDPIEELSDPRAKVVTVRVAWRRTEGKVEQGEVVLRGLSVQGR